MVGSRQNSLAVLGFLHRARRTLRAGGVTAHPPDATADPTTTRRRRRGTGPRQPRPGGFGYYPAGAGIVTFSRLGRSRRVPRFRRAARTRSRRTRLSRSAARTTRYRIVSRSGRLIDVGRLYLIRSTPPAALPAQYLSAPGSRGDSRRGPSAGRTTAESFDITTAAGLVQWSQSGSRPYINFPSPSKSCRASGRFSSRSQFHLHRQPASSPVVALPGGLCDRKPVDVRVAVALQPGALSTTVPASSWEGTAYTRLGLEREKVIHLDSWTYSSDTTNITAARPRVSRRNQDEVIEGSVTYQGIRRSTRSRWATH